MNAWFLVAALVVAFVFGYRFYAKLLALDVFRLDKNYSTPAQVYADGRDYVPTHPHVLIGHHLAATGGVALFAAPLAAAVWGWVPAFLWIVVGTAVAAGTYGLGMFWISLRHSTGLRELAAQLLGQRARPALFFLAWVTLVILIAACAGAVAALLSAYPSAVLPTVSIALIALILGSFLHGRAAFELLPASILAFVTCLLAAWLLSGVPLAFNGALAITVGKQTWLTINAVLIWLVLILVYAFQATRTPIWRVMRPRAFLTSLLLLVLLLIFYVGLGVEHPRISAPEFDASGSSSLPWLFLVVGPGALAGWQLLIVHHVTAREMRRETEASYVGYGAALIHGVVALSALLIGTTGFADVTAWSEQVKSFPNPSELPRLATIYIEGFAKYAASLRLDPVFARTLAATVIIGLTLAVLESAMRALNHLLAETSRASTSGKSREGERGRLWTIVLAAGLLAVHDGRGLGGLAAWPLLAIVSLWLAAIGFALVAAALRTLNRSILIVGGIGVIVAGLAIWSSIAQLWLWWRFGEWLFLGAGLLILLAVVPIVMDVVGAIGRNPQKPSDALDS